LDGSFKNFTVNGSNLDCNIFYDSNTIRLIVNGTYSGTFAELPGLSYNRKEIAKVLDAMPAGKGFDALIDDMKNNMYEEEQAAVLGSLSAYFLSNIIRSAAINGISADIYDKIANNIENDTLNRVFWFHTQGGQSVFAQDANSTADYTDSFFGASAGFNKYDESRELLYGAYFKASGNDIKQDENKAEGRGVSAGVYGYYASGAFDIKAVISGSYNMFETKRKVLGETAEGSVDVMAIASDIEGSLRYQPADEIVLRPSVGFEMAEANYSSFSEKNGGVYDLSVKGGNYSRQAAKAGASVEFYKNIFSCYLSVGGKYLLSATQPELEAAFSAHPSGAFKSKGAKEENIGLSAGLGGEAAVTDNFKIFFNAKYYGAGGYTAAFGNAGARYSF
jgi:hypothetical protein